ncbi:hypothetical protein BCR39DRAFT_184731 [Naematelia encephala]|uniref:Uncharacterized protein n=1 Tax=Naematelia encephala TaxID=71784 RepID=A0A1Y2B2H5_9TREE|nr:hypothetical protein BCR39DRAFT_184731 [Naematelia encephala]
MDSPTLPSRQLVLGAPVSPSRPPRLSMVDELADHEEDDLDPTPATPSLRLHKSAISLSDTSVASSRHSTPQLIQRSPLNYPFPAPYSPSHSSSTHRISTYHYSLSHSQSQHAPPSPASSASIALHSPPSPTRSFTRLSPPSPASPFVVKSRLLRSQVSMDAVEPSRPSVSPVSVYSELPIARTRRTSDTNTSIPHMLRHEAEQDEDEIRGYAETHRSPVDHALRSAPGVVGLGDGWAGGPQPRNRKRWFRRSVNKGADEQDPLALWAIDQSGEQPARSPFKAMWNRSKTFFSGSTPVLGADTNRSPRYRGFFSPSKANFTQASRDGKASIIGLFSRSRDGLNNTKSASQLSVPGMTSAFPTPPPRSKPIMGRNAFARSLPLLSSFSSSPKNARPWPSSPRRESAVWPSPPRESAVWLPPRESVVWQSSPPRRESAVFPTAAHSVQTSIIPEMDERQDSASSSSLETPQTPQTSRHAHSKEVKTLRRSATFGANDITRELGIRDEYREHETEVGLDTLALWANEGRARDRVDRTSTIPTPIAFVPLKDERPSRSSRPKSLLGRLRTSLTPSQSSSTTPSMSSRTSSPSPLRSIRRKATLSLRRSATPASRSVPPDTDDPAYQITQHVVAHALDTPPKERPSDKKQRRVTWRGTGGSPTWLKRLSKLTESDETETAPSNRWSFMEQMTPARTSSLASLHVLSKQSESEERPLPKRGSAGSWARPIPASVSMPALHLDLPIESGLGLDDILDPERRARFVESTHQRESTLRCTPDTLNGKQHEKHSRWTSEPLVIPSRTSSIGGGASVHVRNKSVPSDAVPALESAISNPASAPDEPVVTPRSSKEDFLVFAPLGVSLDPPRPLFAQQPRVEFTRPPRAHSSITPPRSPSRSPFAQPLRLPLTQPARLPSAQDAPVWDLTERSESNSPQSSRQSPHPPSPSTLTQLPRSPRTQAARLSFVQDNSMWDLTDSISSHLQHTGGDLPPLLPSPPATPVKSFEWSHVRRGSAFSEGSQASFDSDTGETHLLSENELYYRRLCLNYRSCSITASCGGENIKEES